MNTFFSLMISNLLSNMDFTKDLMDPSQRAGALKLQPASMSGGGKAAVMSGGGYVGVAFTPQRTVGGMMGRMAYGSRCAPVFKGELYQGGAKSKSKKEDCGCEEKADLDSLKALFMMRGGGAAPDLITQFSGIRAVSPIFANSKHMSTNNIIAIILLIFGHSYAIQYGNKKSKMMSGGGGVGNGMFVYSQILRPLGTTHLIAIASLLLLHYFAVRNKRLHLLNGGSKEANGSQIFGKDVVKCEMKIKEMIGGHSIYKELESIFLNPPAMDGGASTKKKSKIQEAVEPLEKESFIARGFMRLLKKLFVSFYHTLEKKKKSSEHTYTLFKKIFNTITPISVAIHLKKKSEKTKSKNK